MNHQNIKGWADQQNDKDQQDRQNSRVHILQKDQDLNKWETRDQGHNDAQHDQAGEQGLKDRGLLEAARDAALKAKGLADAIGRGQRQNGPGQKN